MRDRAHVPITTLKFPNDIACIEKTKAKIEITIKTYYPKNEAEIMNIFFKLYPTASPYKETIRILDGAPVDSHVWVVYSRKKKMDIHKTNLSSGLLVQQFSPEDIDLTPGKISSAAFLKRDSIS